MNTVKTSRLRQPATTVEACPTIHQKCPECDGTGRIEHYRPGNYGNWIFDYGESCWRCNRRGYLADAPAATGAAK